MDRTTGPRRYSDATQAVNDFGVCSGFDPYGCLNGSMTAPYTAA